MSQKTSVRALPVSSLIISSVTVIVAVALLMFAHGAHASVTPTLTLSPVGDGNSVSMNVSGDPDQSVVFYYMNASGSSLVAVLGNTSDSGTYSTTISSSTYGINAGTPAHVTIGGLNGSASPVLIWPMLGSTTGTLTLSQTSLTVGVGQSTTVSVTNPSGNSLTVTNNTNPSVASISISGNQLTITGSISGSTNISVCTTVDSSNCPTLAINVSTGTGPQLTFSQNNVTVPSGQNVTISVSGGNGGYTITNNSNPGSVSAYLSGSNLIASMTSSVGSGSVTVCSSDLVSCGVFNISAGTTNSTSLTLAPSFLTVAAGQSSNVTISGGTTPYYVQSNTTGIYQATVSGNTLIVYGIATGSTQANVCSSTGTCTTFPIVVAPAGTITTTTSNSTFLTASQVNPTVTIGQTVPITLSGGNGVYSVAYNANPGAALASVFGNTLSLTGVSSGADVVVVCSTNTSCVAVSAGVGSVSAPAASTPVPTPAAVAAGCVAGNMYNTITGGLCPISTVVAPTSPAYTFTSFLTLNSSGAEVLALQKKLAALGYFTATPNGNFGPLTEAAVKKFQKAEGLTQAGYVGPATRTALNEN